MILLEDRQTGERYLVRNAVGYGHCRLIDRKAPLPTESHAEWCPVKRRWVPDAEAQAKAARLAAMRDPEALLAIIEDLTARIAALETKAA